METRCVIVLPFLLMAGLAVSCSSKADDAPIRPPAVAGAFYPGGADELGQMVDAMLAQANPPAVAGSIRAMIVPHAGYVYSGPVAAYGYKALAGRKYGTVVIVGNSHHAGYDGAAIWPKGKFRTPLGDVPIDEVMAAKLLAASGPIIADEGPHIPEHSIEVQLPFLQKVLGDFKLVPILLGSEDSAVAKAVGEALAATVDNDTLVIASTDLSHYPSYPDACSSDAKTVAAVLTGNTDMLEKNLRQMESMRIPEAVTFMCGEGGVKAVMTCAQRIGASQITLLKYGNSGDTAGTKDRVVGYAAIAFSGGEIKARSKKAEAPGTKDEGEFSPQEREALLKLARLTVETVAKTGGRPAWSNSLPGLEKQRGAFVTLKKNGQLRGCIGHFEADMPIYQTVIEMAVAAATQDYRFRPVTPGELGAIDYEISVLSPLRKVDSWKDIQYGKQGVQVTRGFHRGVFLPQVATETGWDFETFMNELCTQKAALPADAWKDPQTDLYVFTAEVFGDKE